VTSSGAVSSQGEGQASDRADDRRRGRDGKPEVSLILETCVHTLFHTALLFSVFLLFAGHNAPGGGFVGGLVAGAAFVLRYVQGGAEEVDDAAPVSGSVLMGIGLTLAVATGAAAWLGGEEFLSSGKLQVDVPLVGVVKATSALAFDIGVYLVVVGLVVSVLTTLGAESEYGGPTEEAP
jgi:multicomponent Na+:H+ antiporter subunit A